MRLDVAIRAKVHVRASGERHDALGEVAFALEPGEVCAIVGPSGCGKTSLLRIIAGLDPRFEGSVTPGARSSAMVFQEPRLLPWKSVDDNIAIVAPQLAAPARAALLAAVGLDAHGRHFPGELSLGLARRAALARALAVEPSLLLLDEPFASLDEMTAKALVGVLAAQFASRRMSAILVSHDVAAAVALADVVHVLSARPGRLVASVRIAASRETRTAAQCDEALRRIAAAG